ncbi:MAG: hypothetical protein V4662_14330 [Verrucomicrobiota bacterium]
MKPLTIALAASTAACVLALAWVLSTPAPTDPRVVKLESELKEARDMISQLRRDLANKPVASGSAPATTGLSASRLQLGAPSVDTPAPATTTGGALREMLKNPAMRDLLGQQQAVQIETSYARLIEGLQMNDEEKAHFKKLLTERAKLEADLGLKLLDSNLTNQQRQQLLAEAEKNKVAYDETIRKFLNNDGDWNTFQTYEVTRPERVQFETMGRSMFSATGEPLNAQQEDQLIQLMAQTRQNPSPEQATLMKNMTNPAQMSEANLQTYLEYQRASNARALEQAAAFLSSAQLKALQNYQEQQMNLIKNGYQMGSMLMGGK